MGSNVGTSTLPDFSPPANLQEFNDETKKIWSANYISTWMTGEIAADPSIVSPGRTPLQQYFNGTVTPFNAQQTPAPVTWNAFPKLVTAAYKTEPLRWQVADASRMFQDEYLEWSVDRNATTGDINSATFTCEGPEYWSVYASYQTQDFINTMKSLNEPYSSQMNDADFFLVDPKTQNMVYNPNNYWNVWSTTGSIAHLIQPNNTLSAEIDIAAQATVLRKDADGKPVTDPNQLIKCSKYGNPGRNSDPTIGGSINALAQTGSIVSVADPVALYIHDFDTSNFVYDTAKTSGSANQADLKPIANPEEVFVFTRGDITKQQGLRLQIRIPEGTEGKLGQQLNVSNIWDKKTKQHIRYGSQIADYVTMGVDAVVISGQQPAAPIPCYKPPSVANVESAMSDMGSTSSTVKTPKVGRVSGRRH